MKLSLFKRKQAETENFVLSNTDTKTISALTSSGKEIVHTLHRLIAKRDLMGIIKKGDALGYVESKNNISENAIIDVDSMVYGSALVSGEAYVHASEICDATIEDHAVVDCSQIFGKTQICDKALIENSKIQGNAEIYDNVQIRNSKIQGSAKIFDNAILDGAKIQGCAEIYDQGFVKNSTIQGHANIFDRARVENSTIQGNVSIHDRAKVKNSVIQDIAHVHDQAYIFSSTLRGNVDIGGKEKIENQTILDEKSIYDDSDLATTIPEVEYVEDMETKPATSYSIGGDGFESLMNNFNKTKNSKTK